MREPTESERPSFTPSARISGDWSAHIATTLDRTADALAELVAEQWEAPSLCEGWRVRDVAGHLVWRLGEPIGGLMRSASRTMMTERVGFDAAIAELARREAEAPTDDLIAALRRIAETKVYRRGRTGIGELTEAVVHSIDIFEAIGVPLRLSPRSTSAVAVARLKTRLGPSARAARGRTLVSTDARWRIGSGEPIEGTAAQLVAALYGRIPLPS
ncbi:hypothetical protein GCM10011490_05840 [Pseudoclavibacter endophyticus]|uniref:maleylpyruvate isomerase family mycothiol-dependent enzyme n=1 Tax=Pseudoclavibacter endophyticus TaxID=1778590 RepID=UPI001664F824|nr:maleylpyruvate isomerase family mycothiol-dependent enzyme [Pseudoclavibacter endophyticus]GGA58728.1 hypothetical protein GCM10011490_05840 [Pseudoclavibacter endophyticus]